MRNKEDRKNYGCIKALQKLWCVKALVFLNYPETKYTLRKKL